MSGQQNDLTPRGLLALTILCATVVAVVWLLAR